MRNRTGTHGRKPLLAVCVIAVLVVCAGCRRRSSSPVRDFWPKAEAVAREWHEDAYVIDIVGGAKFKGKLDWSDADPPHPLIHFHFASRAEDYVVASVACDYMDGCELYAQKDSDSSLAQCVPITLDDLVLDAQDVLEVTLEYGEQYRELDSVREVFFQIARDDPDHFWLNSEDPGCTGDVYWMVTVKEVLAESGLGVLVDAATGEVARTTD